MSGANTTSADNGKSQRRRKQGASHRQGDGPKTADVDANMAHKTKFDKIRPCLDFTKYFTHKTGIPCFSEDFRRMHTSHGKDINLAKGVPDEQPQRPQRTDQRRGPGDGAGHLALVFTAVQKVGVKYYFI